MCFRKICTALFLLGINLLMGTTAHALNVTTIDPDKTYDNLQQKLMIYTTTNHRPIISTTIPNATKFNNADEARSLTNDKFSDMGWWGKSFSGSNGNSDDVQGYIFDRNSLNPQTTMSAHYPLVGEYNGRQIGADVTTTNTNAITKYDYKPNGKATRSNQAVYGFFDCFYNGVIRLNVNRENLSIKFFYVDDKSTVDFGDDKTSTALLSFNSLNGWWRYSITPQPSNMVGEYVGQIDGLQQVFKTQDSILTETPEPLGVRDATYKLPYDLTVIGGKNYNFVDRIGSTTFTRGTAMFRLSGTQQNFVLGSTLLTINGYESEGDGTPNWTSFSSGVIFEPRADTPTKTVELNNESVDGESVANFSKLTFKINQKVGTLGQDILRKYRQMSIDDTFDNNFRLPSDTNAYKIIDSKGASYKASDVGQLTINGQNVHFEFKYDFLQNTMNYDGRTYSLVINDVVAVNSTSENLVLANGADVTINKFKQSTNKVTVNVRDFDQIQPHKYGYGNYDLDEPDKNAYISRGLCWNYNIEVPINTMGVDINHRYSKFEIIDPLDKRITVKNLIVMRNISNHWEGIPVDENAYDWWVDDDNVLHIAFRSWWLEEMPMDGGTYSVTTFNFTKTGEVLGTKDISNQAYVKFNNHEPMYTNTISNPVKNSPCEFTKMVKNGRLKDNVDNISENWSDAVSVKNNQDEYLTYQLTGVTGDSAKRTRVTFDDTLEPVFKMTDDLRLYYYVGSVIANDLNTVLDEAQLNLGNNVQTITDKLGNTLNIKFDSKTRHLHVEITNPKGVQNYAFKFKFEVKTLAYANYSKYYKGGQIKVPNVGYFTESIDGGQNNSLTSATTVSTDVINQSLTKRINYDNKSDTNMNVKYNDDFNYVIDLQLSNVIDYGTANLSDSLADVVHVNNIKMTNKTLNSNCDFTFANNNFTAQIDTTKVYNYTVEIDASIDVTKDIVNKLRKYEGNSTINVPNIARLNYGDTTINSNRVDVIVAPIVFVGMDMVTMPYGSPTVGVGAVSLVQNALVAPNKAGNYQSNVINFTGINEVSSIIDNWTIDGRQVNSNRIVYRTINLGEFRKGLVLDGMFNTDNLNFKINPKDKQPTARSVYLTASKDLTDGAVNYDLSDPHDFKYDKVDAFTAGKINKVPYLTTHYYDLDSQLNENRQYASATKIFYVPVAAKVSFDDAKLMSPSSKSLTSTSAKAGYNIAFNSLFLMGNWYGGTTQGDIVNRLRNDELMGELLVETKISIPSELTVGGDKTFILNNYYRQGFDNVSDVVASLRTIENRNWKTSDFIELSDATIKTSYAMSLKRAQDLAANADKLHQSNSILVPSKLSTAVLKFNLPYTALGYKYGKLTNIIDFSRFDKAYSDFKGLPPLPNAKNQIALTDFVDNGTYKMSENFGVLFSVMNYVGTGTPIIDEYSEILKLNLPLEIYGHRFITKQDGFNSDAQDEINIQPATSGLQKDDSTALGEFIGNNKVE